MNINSLLSLKYIYVYIFICIYIYIYICIYIYTLLVLGPLEKPMPTGLPQGPQLEARGYIYSKRSKTLILLPRNLWFSLFCKLQETLTQLCQQWEHVLSHKRKCLDHVFIVLVFPGWGYSPINRNNGAFEWEPGLKLPFHKYRLAREWIILICNPC